MTVYQKKSRIDKDDKCWYYQIKYVDAFGVNRKYFSVAYKTQEEAREAEKIKMKFLQYNDSLYNDPNITFIELYHRFYEFQDNKVKLTTKTNYTKAIVYFKQFWNIKVNEFTYQMFEQWHKDMNKLEYADRTKNGALKFFKAVLNFGMKWYNIDCRRFYNLMYGFRDPNKIPEEMDFYTIPEFRKFISVETDLKYICAFKVLYYCGLRCGELRGLTWDNIDFRFNTLRVNKNVVKYGNNGKSYTVTSPKTLKSIRTLPVPINLMKELQEYKKMCKRQKNFKETWFVFGNKDPIVETTLRMRKNRNAQKAKVKQIRIHDFRHSCVSLLINSGANITLVATYMGHSKIEETLNTYAHLYRNTLDGIVSIMNQVDTDDSIDEIDLVKNKKYL